MKLTIHEIAKASNVSIATVSKVLNNREGVSEQVRLKVLQTAERLEYYPYIKARETGLFRKKAKYIAEVFGNAHHSLIYELEQGISQVVSKYNYYEVKHFLSHIEERNIDKVKLFINNLRRDQDIAGLIILFVKLNDKIISDLVHHKLFTVLVNTRSDLASCVIVDNIKSSYMATEYLIKTGCKKIGIIVSDAENIDVWSDRIEGYKKALIAHSIKFSPDQIEYENTFEPYQTKLATKLLLERNPKLDGIVFASDWQAYAGIQYLKEKKVAIPDDVSVVGFDDLKFNEFIHPRLTSIKQPMEVMGQTAMNLLGEMIKKDKIIRRTITLESNIVVRETTRTI
ncbi:MAG: LacI family transcriptional regulator [Spirochaetes bacterium]|nr:LacI family transcriptional regulator [Spirochaetota bacterium]